MELDLNERMSAVVEASSPEVSQEKKLEVERLFVQPYSERICATYD